MANVVVAGRFSSLDGLFSKAMDHSRDDGVERGAEMKFRCRHCGKIVSRDLRHNMERLLLTKRGYRSYCDVKSKTTFLIPLTRREMQNES